VAAARRKRRQFRKESSGLLSMAQITSSSGVFFMASCAWFWRSILLVAFLVRAREIRTTAKRGAPEILKRPTRLIDKGMDNHDPVVPKSKIQNPGLGKPLGP
jgi:hypothetical protein